MGTLINLHELGQKLQGEFESVFLPNDVKLPEEDSIEDTGTPLSEDEIHQRISLLRKLPELLGWEPFVTILNE